MTGVRLLLVEDDPRFAELTAEALETRIDGFEVVTVSDPTEATECLNKSQYDCIVSDYDMQRRTGIELLEEIRVEYPDLPFVLFTGEGSESIASEAMSRGATDYLQKSGGPEQYELLANRVGNAVEQHRAVRRANEHEELSSVVREIDSALVHMDSIDKIECQVCETLSDADPYAAACIAGVDRDTKQVHPRSWAGEGAEQFTRLDMCIDPGSPGHSTPSGRAFHDRTVAVSRDISDDPEYEQWRESATDYVFRSLAVVPLDYEGTLHGLLTLFSTRRFAFDDTEQQLLSGLGGDIADALHAQEGCGTSERREYGRSLERTRRRFEAIIDSPDSLIGILGPDGTLERANQTAVDLVDATRTELEGQMFWETPWWAHSKKLQDRLREWVRQAAAGDHVRFEATHPTADGDDILVDGVLRPVTDPDGEVVSIVAEARDVSDLKENERELATQRDRLERLNRINETLRAVHRELVGVSDREKLETAICESLTQTDVYNSAWIGRYDPETERIRPTAWVDIDDNHMRTLDVRADDSQKGSGPAGRAVQSRTVKAVRDITSAEQTKPWRDRLTSLGIESIAAIPITHGDTVYGIVGVYANRPDVFDDDEQAALAELGQSIGNAFEAIKMQNALERQNERLDKFAGIVSHDLRNPLQVAMGRLKLAMGECDSEHLDDVAAALDRSETLIDDLLTLSREGKTVDQTKPVELADLATDCWKTVATAEASLVAATDRTVHADRSRLRQLLNNLFRNAVEHGGTDVTITVGGTADGFYVADDGPGIPPDERDDVFESGYSNSLDGTGLGLPIVQEIAEAHGWEVHLSEADDGGARFDVTGVKPTGGE